MPRKELLKELRLRLQSLALFRNLLDDPVLASFLAFLAEEKDETTLASIIDLYGSFAAKLYKTGGDLGEHLLKIVQASEYPARLFFESGLAANEAATKTLVSELATLSKLSALSSSDITLSFDPKIQQILPAWTSTAQDFAALYPQIVTDIPTRGYGVFSTNHMFQLTIDSELRAVNNPDPQQLDNLIGYDRERQLVIANTEALLDGQSVSNVLLYGDAGTGKSSTVKALANHFKGKGLRLIEVRKTQLDLIPLLMDNLADNPLKFIIFIDDLSFTAHDTNFTQLKAVLEGSIAARPQNVVIYATSNRRHFIMESFSGRRSDDLHIADSREEETSLAARFGLTITFLKPNRTLYADIVRAYARRRHLDLDDAELLAKAEQYAIKQGERTPRAAKQFVETLNL